MTQQFTRNDDQEAATSASEPLGKAAGSLHDMARLVRERSSATALPGADRAAEAVAQPLESSARYLEARNPADVWADVMTFCRDHPAGALGLGFAAGYLVKKLLP